MNTTITKSFKNAIKFYLILMAFNLHAQAPWCNAYNTYQYNYTANSYTNNPEQIRISTASSVVYNHAASGWRADSTCGSEYRLSNDTSNSFNLIAGNSYTIESSSSSTYGYNAKWGAFIDLNADYDFNDAGEYLGTWTTACGSSGTPGNLTAFNFTIPCSISSSASRLRIVNDYQFATITNTAGCFDCSSNRLYYGATTDFSINLVMPNTVSSSFVSPSSAFVKTAVKFINNNPKGYSEHAWDANNDASYEQKNAFPDFKYTWNTTGTKCVKLRSTNCFGRDSVVNCLSIVAPTAVPAPDFIVDEDTIQQYEIVSLTDLSTNGPWKWEWDVYDSLNNATLANGVVSPDPFGSGRNEFSQNPQFEFDLPGKYTVVLKATNDIGTAIIRKVKYITVTLPTNYILGFGVYGNNANNKVSSPKGSIFDNGGPSMNYSNNQGIGTRSFLTIKPCAAKSITLKFSQLKFADVNDVLKVYDAESAVPSKLIGTYTFGNLSSTTLTAYSGAMHVTFVTNGSGIDSGFKAKYTSVLDTAKIGFADFDVDTTYYEGAPFKIKNKSANYSGDPMFTWYLDGNPIYGNWDLNYTINSKGNYSLKLNLKECDIDDTLTKAIKVVTPISPTNINFTASENYTSKGRRVNLYSHTDKANRFLWKISPTSYKLLNPLYTNLSYATPGTIYYRTILNDTIPMPIIEFLDTVCYTISLTAYNSLDSAATSNYLQKTDYICGKFYKSYFNVYGTVFNDLNNNCTLDSTDDKVYNFPVTIKDSLGNFMAKVYTLSDGIFALNLPDSKYKIELDTPELNIAVNCSAPGVDSMVNKWQNGAFNGVDFPINCNSKTVLKILSVNTKSPVFPGRKHNLETSIGNAFNINCNGKMQLLNFKIKVNGKVQYISEETGYMAPSSISGKNYTFNLKNELSTDKKFSLIFKTDTNATFTDTVKVNLELMYLDNADTVIINENFKYPVTNSYDPNIKSVYPYTVTPGFNDWLTYTIQFQNLGNAPAYNIRIADTLDNLLNPETFRVIAQSHNVNSSLKNKIITFKFNDIMLPDSASDPKGSIGFVQYKIKPYNALVKGNKIKNTAYIYFDYNPAIVTNTTQNECIQASNSSIKQLLNYSFKIYPNPNNGQFIIENNSYIPNQQYLIYDVYGKLVKSIAIKSPKMNVDLSEFANGLYFIKLNSNEINNSIIIVKE